MTTTSHLNSFFDRMNVSLTKDKFYKLELEQEEITDEFVENFKKDYDSLDPKVKEILARSGVMVHSKQEAEELMGISKLFSLLMGGDE